MFASEELMCIMASKSPFFEQEIRDRNIAKKKLEGVLVRGNGLVATRDVRARGQLLFVRQPSTLALDNKRLQDTCYQCLRSSVPSFHSLSQASEFLDVKACIGCQSVRFCDRTCQKLAWSRYHNHECKIYGKLHPRLLPTTARAIIRLLLLRKHDLFSGNEWSQLLKLESHQDDFSDVDGTTWQDISLVAKAVHSYSATSESFDTVLKLCCIFAINSFTLTNPIYEPLGAALHPLPCLINHSCVPNAYIRFDVGSIPAPHGSNIAHHDRLPLGSISVHALKPISKGEEITISYIDASLPTPMRRSELEARYHFTCICSRCFLGAAAVTDMFLDEDDDDFSADFSLPALTAKEAEKRAIDTLALLESRTSDSSLSSTDQVVRIRTALCSLAQTKVWPHWRYPEPQLRQHLITLLIEGQNYYDAMLQAAHKSFPVDEVLCESEDHPTRVLGKWLVYHLARLFLINEFDIDEKLQQKWQLLPPHHDLKMIAALMCMMLDEVMIPILPPGSHNRAGRLMDKGRQSLQNMSEGRNDAKVRESRAANQTPPPYVGPETKPEGLPQYEEIDGGNDEGSTYAPSTMSQFEIMVAKAAIRMSNGDGKMFWADYEGGRLPGPEDVKLWTAETINDMLDEEELYESGSQS